MWNNKLIKIVLFIFFYLNIEIYAIVNKTDSVIAISCFKLSNIEYIYQIKNISKIDLYISDEYFLQQGQDTMWFDNTWNRAHNSFVKYIYSIDTFFLESNYKILNLLLMDSVICESGPIFNYAKPKKLVLIKGGEIFLKRVYFSTRFISPSKACFRIFFKKYNKNDFDNDKYMEFVRKESFLITVNVISANMLSSPIWAEICK